MVVGKPATLDSGAVAAWVCDSRGCESASSKSNGRLRRKQEQCAVDGACRERALSLLYTYKAPSKVVRLALAQLLESAFITHKPALGALAGGRTR